MTPDRWKRVKELFAAADALAADEREAFLRLECADDTELLQEVRSLLAAAQSVTAVLPARVSDLRAQVEAPGTTIGRYRIVEPLGEGGFGVVYRAEQSHPVRRQVAVKIIKLGMDTRQVIARFEAERQALAIMDHPNIARVIDGGATETGRPYFVMELVEGERITDYCDRNRLSVRQRMELLVPVCQAVQHAHQKGIIHRDIKPSNVLIALVDGRPTPKVIDFGVSKAIDQRLTEMTVFTQEAQLIGTPAYMSPEQAGGELDIDTRTDVYALGVLMYELLTGVTPLDTRSLRGGAFDEMRRLIREVEPPRPSTRLSTIDELPSVAASRAAEPATLSRAVRGELDWIVMKCLEKDRARRYETANGLAADIQRYLNDEPVVAGPPSRAYRVRKAFRRNKAAFATAAAFVIVLTAATAVSLWQAGVARAERDRAVSAEAETSKRADELRQVSEFQSQMLSQIDTTKAGIDLMKDVRERFAAALEKAGVPEGERASRMDALQRELVRVNATDLAAAMIDRTILKPAVAAIDRQFKEQPVVDAQLRQVLANLYFTIGLYESAMPLQESALATRRKVLGEEHPDTLSSIHYTASLLNSQGNHAEAERHYREAIEKSRRALGEEHPETLVSINGMGALLRNQGRLAEAESYFRETLERHRRVLGEVHHDTLVVKHNMGNILESRGKLAEAEAHYREVLSTARGALGEEHPRTLTFVNSMGFLLKAQGKQAEAEPYYREAMEKRRRVLGEEHPATLVSISNMGALLLDQGKLAAAEPYFRETLEKRRRVLGEAHPDTLAAIANMGSLLQRRGELAKAEPYYREALQKRQLVLGEAHPDTIISINNMGNLLEEQGELAAAEPYYVDAVNKARHVLGEEHYNTLIFVSNLGALKRRLGRLSEAEALLDEAIEKFRRLHGDEHANTLISINHKALLLLAQAKYQDAIDLLAPAEPAARKAFTGGNARRLATLLSALGRARVGLGYEAERFRLAEANLLEAHPIFVQARGQTNKGTLECVQGLADLYTVWDASAPGSGHAERAAEWRARLVSGDPPATKPN